MGGLGLEEVHKKSILEGHTATSSIQHNEISGPKKRMCKTEKKKNN